MHTFCNASFNLQTDDTHSYTVVQRVSTYVFSLPPSIPFNWIASLSHAEAKCEFLKYFVTLFAHLIRLLIRFTFTISELIKLMQCAIHLTFKIFGYSSYIIRRAAAIFDPLSETIATNFSGPTVKITFLIISTRCWVVCRSLERSSKLRRYSFLKGVIKIKIQKLFSWGSVHPSKANKLKYNYN